MKRNHLLRSILWTCVCLLATSAGHQVLAQNPTTEGQLLAVDAKGQPAGPCPLKHTNVKAEISGFVARVTVTQQFQNPFPDKIEAVYTFPLPQAAAVDDMTIVIGERTVKGKIMRREEAQATYDAAKARGQTAALLNQQRPNIFTQAVANILPSQQINVEISYVETLKYEEGSYEWDFPMVVGEHYLPAARNSDPAQADVQPGAPADSQQSSEAQSTNPPVMPPGMRAGHDISIEVNIDAGVPLISFQSSTHEIEAVQPGTGKAVVRLKDQATIPNKDFILKYDVAGSQIEDALLFHRHNDDGYFTFILQPPQRVTVSDVMPKELVFVLDTSGSMSGFPIEKAKETMLLALNSLYPEDTFNLILFSGDTKILFPAPVPATPENVNRARKLVSDAKGEGGTEMMPAIRAALDPSDASDHVRISCFMTDGLVGNDLEIISEVQKHPNARVFAMGFGNAPNRFLLDKITQNGRGEVQYVTENSEAKRAAQRFHERVRNPLLTDVTIDWGGLPVTDVYPKKIPDLFSAKPVILSGRYTGPGKGIIRLRGKMSGQEFVREIPVEFPAQSDEHDVLGTLWARSKVAELMDQNTPGASTASLSDELKTEITNLGIAHRMMTQFTSFVAVDEKSPADGITPRRIDVPVEASGDEALRVASSGAAMNMSVTVASSEDLINSTSATLGNTVSQRSIVSLPVNGRSMSSLYLVAPGSVSTGANDFLANTQFNVSVNGQRPSSNQITIDGVSANDGIAPGGQSPGASAGGSAPGLTVIGDTAAVAPFNSIYEVQIRTHSATADYGRNSGGMMNVVSKAGTNTFHGSAFGTFGNHGLEANDWFANSRGLLRPQANSNEFGGTFGGPLKRDHYFFFTSYEGLRVNQAVTSLTDVPSLSARLAAPGPIGQLLNLYPRPNGPARSDGLAEYAAAFASPARHDAGRLRLDLHPTSSFTFTGSYNFAGSSAIQRDAQSFSTNTFGQLLSGAHAASGHFAYTVSPTIVTELWLNYSRLSTRSAYSLDEFGGAVVPPESVFSQAGLALTRGSFANDLNGHHTTLLSAAGETSTQRQFNLIGSVNMISGNHAMKFGVDYRRIFPTIGLRPAETQLLLDGVAQAMTGVAARLSTFGHQENARPIFNDFAAYALDEWRVTSRLTFNYGIRWEVDPAPANDNKLLAVTSVSDPFTISIAPVGSRLWTTTYGNLAPRASLAYQLNKDGNFVLRGGFGLLYDNANPAVGEAFAESYPSLVGESFFNVPLTFLPAPTGSGSPVDAPFSVFDPALKLPLSLQWNISLEREIGHNQTITAAYGATANRRLLLTTTFVNPNPSFSLVRMTNNDGRSDYRSLQLQFKRRFSKGLSAIASYTWGKSEDNFSDDSASRALFRATDSQIEWGPSDFDVRHTFTGFVLYDIPNPFSGGFAKALARNWSLDSVFFVHSDNRVNVLYAVPTTFGFLYLRPDLKPGVPAEIFDATVGGARRINADAFAIPEDLRQGTLGRNALPGFPLAQLDLALHRRFNFTEDVKLTIGIQAANILNHPNFASPDISGLTLGTRFAPAAFSRNQTFGQSFANAARGSAGVLGANYYPGGPRTVRLSARLEF